MLEKNRPVIRFLAGQKQYYQLYSVITKVKKHPD